MTGSLIVVLAVLAALGLRLFWREILQVAGLLVLIAVFVGILTLVADLRQSIGGG